LKTKEEIRRNRTIRKKGTISSDLGMMNEESSNLQNPEILGKVSLFKHIGTSK
jgi:hypothetical protein